MNGYKIQQSKKSNGYESYSITVPQEIARMVPEGMKFVFQIAEEGILLRPLRTVEDELPPRPAWLDQDGNDA